MEAAVFFGNIHAHTSYSDGAGDPFYAFEYARKVAGLDFQAVTDHAYYFVQPLPDGKDRYLQTLQAASLKTVDGDFVAIAGFEWTGGVGHINVYESKKWVSRNELGLFDLYRWIVKNRVLAQFNHPIRRFGTFYDFKYVPAADRYLNLIEVGNGNWASGDIITFEMEMAYRKALTRGWHVGATANQDNHKPNWGTANEARTAVIAEKLTKSNILKALMARHTYATEDSDASVTFACDEAIMGDIVYDVDTATLTIKFCDPMDPAEKVWLVSEKGENLLPVSGDAFVYTVKVPVKESYEWYYVKIREADGDEIITSPIWFQSSSKVYLLAPRLVPSKPTRGEKIRLFFDVVNHSHRARRVKVELRSPQRIASTLFLSPLSVISTSVGFVAEQPRVEVFLNDERALAMDVELVDYVVKIDTTHENYHSLFELLLEEWEKHSVRVEKIERLMKKSDIVNIDVLILPLPGKEGFFPLKKLKKMQMEAIAGFVRAGGILLVISSPNGVEEDVLNTYRKLLETLNLRVQMDEMGKSLETGEYKVDKGLVFIVNFEELESRMKISDVVEKIFNWLDEHRRGG